VRRERHDIFAGIRGAYREAMAALDIGGYLARLGIADPGPPSAEGLRALHAAHVERIPYEALEIQLGRPTTVDPHESAERIVCRHRGGYCFHLNGAFSLLLAGLGYDVTWHRGGVQNRSDPVPVGAIGNHLPLTVAGLPSPDSPSGDWLVDVGLGDGLHEPLPLRTGRYRQGPFTYELRPSVVEPGGWRFEHDRLGSFTGMDFRPQLANVEDFVERHRFLSTSPDSGFVRTCSVHRRDARGVDVLTGCVLRRVGDGAAPERVLDTPSDWFGALADVFDLPLTDVADRARGELWARVWKAHEAWVARDSSPRRDRRPAAGW
jgi:arylamine N-acetyltransferase